MSVFYFSGNNPKGLVSEIIWVDNIYDIVDGKTYVLLTLNEGMVYKRVYNKIKENGMLVLVSDNRNYLPYEVHISEVLELWEFTCSINTKEYSKEELKISSILSMFNSLGVELETLKKL